MNTRKFDIANKYIDLCEKVNRVHSAIFELESAAKTLDGIHPSVSARIQAIAKALNAEYGALCIELGKMKYGE